MDLTSFTDEEANPDDTIILASASPRRRAILEQLYIKFCSMPANVDETFIKDESPESTAARLAEMKCRAITKKLEDKWSGYILGADTVVAVGEKALGTPVDIKEAESFLSLLSGREHRVITGLCLAVPSKSRSRWKWITDIEITKVRFRELDERSIDNYLRSGEWSDKAGAYGIQGFGAALVKKIEGCYYNVVGLPVSKLLELLGAHGFKGGRIY